MSRIRSRDTGPERALRTALKRSGIRYRSYMVIGGVRVDLALPDARVVVLVHGCFWHGCPRHYTAPSNNAEFWRMKLDSNRRRDRRQLRSIRAAGWRVEVVWEHSVARRPVSHLESLVERLTRPGPRRRRRPQRVPRQMPDQRHRYHVPL